MGLSLVRGRIKLFGGFEEGMIEDVERKRKTSLHLIISTYVLSGNELGDKFEAIVTNYYSNLTSPLAYFILHRNFSNNDIKGNGG